MFIKKIIDDWYVLSSTTITFRISKKNDDYLRKRAEQERVSVNIIANKTFNEYIEWQQFIEKVWNGCSE